MKGRFILFFALFLILPLRLHAAVVPTPSDAQHRIQLVEDDGDGISTELDDEGRYIKPEDTSVPSATLQPSVTAPSSDQQQALPSVSPTTTADQQSALVESATTQALIQSAFPWAWVITRGAGISSYILLALLAVVGMLLTTGILYRAMSPSTAWSLHRAIATVLLFSVLTHLGAMLFDRFINLRLVEVLIPFVSHYRPLLVALGIGGFYLLLLVLITSLYTLTSHPRFWRSVHAFTFVTLPLLFLHGVLLGTDRHTLWVILMYWITALAVGLTVLYRLYWKYHTPSASPKNSSSNNQP